MSSVTAHPHAGKDGGSWEGSAGPGGGPAPVAAPEAWGAHLRRLFEHVRWGDARTLHLLTTSPAARQPPAMRLLSHLLAAERIWLLRIRGEDAARQPIWPELALEEMHAMAAANAAGYARLLAAPVEALAAARVRYANSSGVVFETAVADILTHVALHGSYHRGQIASLARAGSAEPVNTDFITFVREGDGRAAG